MAKKKTNNTGRGKASSDASRNKRSQTHRKGTQSKKGAQGSSRTQKGSRRSTQGASGSQQKRGGPAARPSRSRAEQGEGSQKSRIASLVEAPVQPNQHLSAKDLERYRKLLLLKRAELVGDLSSMSDGALRLNDASNLSHMPIHMADIGSEHIDQELTLGLVQSEHHLLDDIDHALERIANGTYGICEITGKPIGKARLNIKPWAKHSIEAEREREREQARDDHG